MPNLPVLGRLGFAIALAGSGIMQLASGAFVRLVPGLPEWVPAHPLLARTTGALLVLAAAALLTGRFARQAALAVAALFMVLFVTRHLPVALTAPLTGFMWTNPAKVLALLGGALAIAAQSARDAGSRTGAAGRAARAAPALLALFLLICGVQHFVYAAFVDTLVPAWIPPGARFWTWFTGCALIAGGAGILVPHTAGLAARLTALMILLWVLLLHIPRALGEEGRMFELAGVFEALALTGVALVIAGRVSAKGPGD